MMFHAYDEPVIARSEATKQSKSGIASLTLAMTVRGLK